jgi:hypothetical protein
MIFYTGEDLFYSTGKELYTGHRWIKQWGFGNLFP